MAKTNPPTGGFTAKKAYLVLYNAASASAWAMVLFRVVSSLLQHQDPSAVAPTVDSFARTTQTFAVMEILHALTGPSPPHPFPASPLTPPSVQASSPPPSSPPSCKSSRASSWSGASRSPSRS